MAPAQAVVKRETRTLHHAMTTVGQAACWHYSCAKRGVESATFFTSFRDAGTYQTITGCSLHLTSGTIVTNRVPGGVWRTAEQVGQEIPKACLCRTLK